MANRELQPIHPPNQYPHPPGNDIRHAGHHWLEGFNSDRQPMGLFALQWAPGSKKWFRSGEVDTFVGDVSKTISYVSYWNYIASIEQPDLNKVITGDRCKSPVPPGYMEKMAGHHWIIQVDTDGRMWEPLIFQWNPIGKTWSHSGHHGIDVNLTGSAYLSEVKLPD